MISRNLFFKLAREDGKRRVWLAALSLLIFFFALPVAAALTLSNASETYERLMDMGRILTQTKADYLFDAMKDLLVGNEGMVFLMIPAAVVCGASSFSYLHSRKKVDFYHSIPVRRETLFFVSWIMGILIPAAAYLLGLLISLGVAASYGAAAGSLVGLAVKGWLFHMLYFVFIYSVVVLAMILTGNLIVGILGSAALFFYFPVLALLIEGYFSSFFRTYLYTGSSGGVLEAMMKISPVTDYVTAFGLMEERSRGWYFTEQLAPMLFGAALAAAAVTWASVALYERRPSEAAGKAMAFGWSKPVIRNALSLLFGLAGGLFFWSLHSTTGWAVFGCLIGTLVCHCVVEIIYHFDFRRLFGHRVQLAACAAVSLAVLLCFKNDWIGYDTYLPRESEVESAAVNIGMDYWIEYYEFAETQSGVSWRSPGRNQYLFDTMELKEIGPVLELAEAGICYRLEDSSAEEEYWTDVSIRYTLKSGRTVQRTYSLPLSAAMDAVKEIYTDEAYQDARYPVMRLDAEALELAKVRCGGDGVVFKGGETDEREEITRLLEAYRQDLREQTVDSRMEEDPIAEIAFLDGKDLAYLRQQNGGDSWNYSIGRVGMVYPSFTRTIAELERMGISLESFWEDVTVQEIRVSGSVETEEENEYGETEWKSYSAAYRDQADMDAILPNLYLQVYDQQNFFSRPEPYQAEMVVRLASGEVFTVNAVFMEGEVPDFVREDMEEAEEAALGRRPQAGSRGSA